MLITFGRFSRCYSLSLSADWISLRSDMLSVKYSSDVQYVTLMAFLYYQQIEITTKYYTAFVIGSQSIP